jgi:hypothetical protein
MFIPLFAPAAQHRVLLLRVFTALDWLGPASPVSFPVALFCNIDGLNWK